MGQVEYEFAINVTVAGDISDSVFAVYSCDGQMPGDINADCPVNMLDLESFAQTWFNVAYATALYTGRDDNPNL